MRNKWNYKGLGQVKYGHPESYERPAAFFDEIGGVLEDCGCGCAGMKPHVKVCRYIGIDGSKNDFADRCDVDLREYRSNCDCLLLRGVLDHNEEWEKILVNALASFNKRMVVMIFHDLGAKTKVILRHNDPKFPGVPDLQFCLGDLMRHMQPYLVRIENIPACKGCPNNETLFYLEKK
jgi:hypothetical protein